jgi:hypothetical protein
VEEPRIFVWEGPIIPSGWWWLEEEEAKADGREVLAGPGEESKEWSEPTGRLSAEVLEPRLWEVLGEVAMRARAVSATPVWSDWQGRAGVEVVVRSRVVAAVEVVGSGAVEVEVMETPTARTRVAAEEVPPTPILFSPPASCTLRARGLAMVRLH